MAHFSYSPEGDALAVFKKSEKVDYIVELFEDYFIDIGKNGKIVGLEILNASSALDLKKSDLKNIKKAELYTSEAKGGRNVFFILKVNEKEIKSQIRVPAFSA